MWSLILSHLPSGYCILLGKKRVNVLPDGGRTRGVFPYSKATLCWTMYASRWGTGEVIRRKNIPLFLRTPQIYLIFLFPAQTIDLVFLAESMKPLHWAWWMCFMYCKRMLLSWEKTPLKWLSCTVLKGESIEVCSINSSLRKGIIESQALHLKNIKDALSISIVRKIQSSFS